MAGAETEGWSKVLHRKDERGVIIESRTFGPEDEIPEGFGAAEYTPIYDVREDDQEPVAESVLTPWESPIAKGTWVENRPEDAEVDEGTPVQARDELTGAEQEVADELESDEDDGEDDDTSEFDEGTPVQAREEAGEDLTGAEQEVTEELESDEDDGDQPPPQGGAGSGRDAWAAYASGKVTVTDDMTRDDIIAACEKAGVPV